MIPTHPPGQARQGAPFPPPSWFRHLPYPPAGVTIGAARSCHVPWTLGGADSDSERALAYEQSENGVGGGVGTVGWDGGGGGDEGQIQRTTPMHTQERQPTHTQEKQPAAADKQRRRAGSATGKAPRRRAISTLAPQRLATGPGTAQGRPAGRCGEDG